MMKRDFVWCRYASLEYDNTNYLNIDIPKQDLFLAAARLFGELFRRIGQPALGGELLAGMILGPSLFGIVSSNESLEMLSNIAIFFVLLFIGLEMDIRQVKRTGKPAVILSVT